MKNPYFPNNNNNVSPFPSNYTKVTPFPATLPPINPDGGEKEEEFDIKRFLSVIQRQAVVITLVTGAVTAYFTLNAMNQPSVYEGSFQLLMESKNSGSNLAGISGLPPGISDRMDGEGDYQTQMQILRSPSVLEPIIKNLTKQEPEINYNSLIWGQLQINQLDKTKIIEFRYRDSNPTRVQNVLKTLAQGYMNYSVESKQKQIVQSISFVEKQLGQVGQRVDKLQTTLQQFRQYYNLYSPESSAAQVYGQMEQIEQDKQKTLMELSALKVRYANLRKQMGLSLNQSLTVMSLQEAPQYQSLVKSYSEIDQKIALESSRFSAKSPVIQALKDQQQSLLPLLNQETQQILGVNFSKQLLTKPSVNPSSVLSGLTQQVMQINLEIPNLEAKYNNLNQIQTALTPKVKQQPLIARQYVDLQREFTVANESLNRFLAVGENLEIEKAKQQMPWQLITPPQGFDIPITPNLPKNIFTGLIAGLCLGIGVGLLLEKLNNVFHTPEEIKDFTKLPILGNIPYTKNIVFSTPQVIMNGDNLVIVNSNSNHTTEEEDNDSGFFNSSSHSRSSKKNQNNEQHMAGSPFLESFRNIYTNIQFLNDNPTNSIVISSTLPGDGKSTVSIHLAQAAASMGQRVLLIDADLRRPKVHYNLHLSNTMGLSNMIAMDINIKQALQQLPGWEDLYILTAGQEPPDPTRLLSSKKMQSLMDEFHALFDLVIYDTPPLLALADARLLVPYTDGILMVVSMGKTDRGLLNQALSNLQTSRGNVLGIVANGVKRTAFDSNNYYNHYYRN